jgi:hypothetical protein
MKKIFSIVLSGILIFSATSCKKYLDINKNPNLPTEATPALVLPAALAGTAALIVNTGDYNSYGSQSNGYFGNAGGFGSLGVLISYAYTTGDFNGLFQNTYDNLEDYQYIIDNSDAGSTFNAAANIMKAYDYQMLVDTYNDVPYSEALKGVDKLQPKYDKAEDIYKDLGDKLDAAIVAMKAATSDVTFQRADPLFGGDVTKWAQFANTLKLRLIIRAGGKVTFTKPTPDAATGFLTENAIFQPKYTKTAGKQNPYWDRWAFSETGGARGAGAVFMPSKWIISFFDGVKFSDDLRGELIFNQYNGVSTPSNQLGYTGADAPKSPTPNFWYTYDIWDQSGLGLFKGESAGQPIMLASESYFLQAEANLRGILSNGTTAQENYESGVTEAFKYLYLAGGYNPQQNIVSDAVLATEGLPKLDVAVSDYLSGNADWNAPGDKLEKIITQKYLALIYQFGAETWNEYRRTGFPAITGNTPTTTFASIVSQSTGANKLPTRILYPVSEYSYNQANTPSGISPYTNKIFWAK